MNFQQIQAGLARKLPQLFLMGVLVGALPVFALDQENYENSLSPYYESFSETQSAPLAMDTGEGASASSLLAFENTDEDSIVEKENVLGVKVNSRQAMLGTAGLEDKAIFFISDLGKFQNSNSLDMLYQTFFSLESKREVKNNSSFAFNPRKTFGRRLAASKSVILDSKHYGRGIALGKRGSFLDCTRVIRPLPFPLISKQSTRKITGAGSAVVVKSNTQKTLLTSGCQKNDSSYGLKGLCSLDSGGRNEVVLRVDLEERSSIKEGFGLVNHQYLIAPFLGRQGVFVFRIHRTQQLQAVSQGFADAKKMQILGFLNSSFVKHPSLS